jgi:hypothetical protein
MSCNCRKDSACVECWPQEKWNTPEFVKGVRKRLLDDLEDFLILCKHKYYCIGEPACSDSHYDALEASLRKQRPDSYVLTTVGCGLCYKEDADDISGSTT